MSRSYKRTPGFTEGYGGSARRYYKRWSNKATRRAPDLADGNHYRRLYESWNIVDYAFMSHTRDDLIFHTHDPLEPWPAYKDLLGWKDRRK